VYSDGLWAGGQGSILGRLYSTAYIQALGPTQPSIHWESGVFSQRKTTGPDADHSPPSSSEVKIGLSVAPLPNTSSWRGA
jgi:hypothetical protein